jgi:hypothetical protein
LVRKSGFQQRVAARLHELTQLEYDLGNYAAAEAAAVAALEIARSIDFLFSEAQALCQLGHIAAAQGKPETINFYRWALDIAAEQGMNPIVLDVLWGIAQLRPDASGVTQAVDWLALVASHPNADWETKQKAAKTLATLTGRLAETDFRAAQQCGQRTPLEVALRLARAALETPPNLPSTFPPPALLSLVARAN